MAIFFPSTSNMRRIKQVTFALIAQQSLNRAPKDIKISTPMIFSVKKVLYELKPKDLKYFKSLNYAQTLPIINSLQNILKVRKTIWEKYSPFDEIRAKFLENNDKGLWH